MMTCCHRCHSEYPLGHVSFIGLDLAFSLHEGELLLEALCFQVHKRNVSVVVQQKATGFILCSAFSHSVFISLYHALAGFLKFHSLRSDHSHA